MKISAIIIGYILNENLDKLTTECIDSLKDYDELIYVDNGSKIINPYFQEKADTYLKLKENEGLVKAFNKAAKVATGDIIIFISNDTFLKDGDLHGLAKLINDENTFVHPYIENANGYEYEGPHGVVYAFANKKDGQNVLDEDFKIYFADTALFDTTMNILTKEVRFFHHLNQTGKFTGDRISTYKKDNLIFIQKYGYDPES